jgi:methylated-DNA-[protein]-cysteine S-methyltransferase
MTAPLSGHLSSPIGTMEVTVDDAGAVTKISFVDGTLADTKDVDDACARAIRQLEEYFRGARRRFRLPLAPEGTEFEHRVWAEVCRIPFGSTDTYGEIARRLRDPDAARAVGAANARNPIAIVIPCHRVVGTGGDLTGYAGGIERKKWLLDHESDQQRFDF